MITQQDDRLRAAAEQYGIEEACPIIRSMYTVSRSQAAKSFEETFLAGAKYERDRAEGVEKALDEAITFLSGGILRTGEYVKQLDGSVLWELVPTYQSKLVDNLKQAIAAYREL